MDIPSLPPHLLTPPGRPSPPPASLCWGNTSLPRSRASSWSLGKLPDLRAYCIHPATPAQWLAPSVRVLLHPGNTPHLYLLARVGPTRAVGVRPTCSCPAGPCPDLRARGPARRLPEATHRGHLLPPPSRGLGWSQPALALSRAPGIAVEAERVLGSGGPARDPAGVSRARGGRGVPGGGVGSWEGAGAVRRGPQGRGPGAHERADSGPRAPSREGRVLSPHARPFEAALDPA